MTARFRRGLVVGKFAPLHRGHEQVIRTAFAQCDEVILISYSRPELPGCAPARRERWLSQRFPAARLLVVTPERVREWQLAGLDVPELPDNAAEDEAQRHFVAQLCLQVLRVTVDAVFTSEAYGDGFAASLSRHFATHGAGPVTHVEVDRARRAVPVSGSALRADPHGLRQFLAPEVYADFVERICLLGGESSGKSTLAAALATALDTVQVEEYGRECWLARGGQLAFDDLRHIAETQVAREAIAALRATRWLVCDTSPLTTLLYSRHLFGRADPVLERLAERPYAYTFLCAPDFPFVQDGTRSGPGFRALQHRAYLLELPQRGIPFTLLQGPVAQRVATVRDVLARVAASPQADAVD